MKAGNHRGGVMGKVVVVTDKTFAEEVLKSELPTEVDF